MGEGGGVAEPGGEDTDRGGIGAAVAGECGSSAAKARLVEEAQALGRAGVGDIRRLAEHFGVDVEEIRRRRKMRPKPDLGGG
jgi:hypothetical protein